MVTENPDSGGHAIPEPDRHRQLSAWVQSVFPLPLEDGEYIVVQPYWKPDWPNPQPPSFAPQPQVIRSRDDLVKYLGLWGTRNNLGVSYATYKSKSRGPGRNKASFFQTSTLAIDLDYGEGKVHKTEADALAALKKAELKLGITPILIVRTGGGLQAYFGLGEPTRDFQLADDLVKRLTRVLGGDPGAASVVQVLRPPGTQSFKYSPPVGVTLLAEGSVRYSVHWLDAQLPRTAQLKSSPRGGKGTSAADGTRTTGAFTLEGLLAGAFPSRFRSLSERDWFVACSYLESGRSDEEVLKLLRASKLGKQAMARKANPADYLERTVQNASAYVGGKRRSLKNAG